MGILSGSLIELFLAIMSYVIYLCILVQFLNQKTDLAKIRFVLIVAGVFFIQFLGAGLFPELLNRPELPWAFTQMAILGLLAMTGIELAIDRLTVLLLFGVFFIAWSSGAVVAFYVGTLAYFFVCYGFIASTFKGVQGNMHE